ncbi:MAG: helix-turn-helix domain-containing protein [Deltaproteobacteria bacterium]|nr:helix-turn-helix domain-containing protein [Deltaproteobacteria bacterium]
MNVYIIGFDQAYASPVLCLMDIFQQAFRQDGSEEMTIRLVSMDGKPILCQNNVQLNVHGAVDDIEHADIFIVTSVGDVGTDLPKYRFLVDWLRNQHNEGTAIASICTGAFLLAETGLLDGKEATTHWTASDLFKERYPRIQLNPEKLIINHGDLYCADGKSAGIDLAYYLVEKYLGHMLAVSIAKFFVHDFRRVSRNTYAYYDAKTDHNDLEILRTQQWIKDHLAETFNINGLLEVACMSLRTFERRFKKATGDTPLVYLQRMRVEVAKHLLETTNYTFDEISYQMGYMNSGSFRKVFGKWAALLPSEYRDRFRSQKTMSLI